ncbi:response regulator [Pedobacter metabolipauper]|uniref:Response regulator receiver domain-containing protein n=1 Tax=Pedobacter metabolipauper TaxID=425513 RepID=A0A4R6T0E9_9SPHI|nr:response regulator [Pedobacter metabolipauper]TDQ11882.1 response regulator receiver domain-containing protein [Pedobacter metabolipauper]
MKRIDTACVIDDDQIYTFGIKKLMAITEFSNHIMIFKNGDEALKYLKPVIEDAESLPDVILLDLNMPIIDGWQFLDAFIKFKLAKKVTIYIVSSSIDTNDYEKAAKYSIVNNFFVKPIRKDDLQRIMEDYAAR